MKTQLHCRCTVEQKGEIETNAASLGMTVTDLILARCRNIPVKDRSLERQVYEAMMALTKEFNQIGRNINQAVTAIHTLKFTDMQRDKRLDEFNALFKQYLDKRDGLSILLENVVK